MLQEKLSCNLWITEQIREINYDYLQIPNRLLAHLKSI